MPTRNITINGVSNSFEWQVGNTTRFINFNTVTDVEYKEDCSTFDVYCGQTIVIIPNELREQFKAKIRGVEKTKMKEYKVGDTIYVKGTVGRTDDTRSPCYVEFGYGVEGWIHRDNIIDELPTAEPVKPVLPKAVADELESAKENCNNFYGFLRDCNSETHPEANQFVFYSCGSSDSRIKILSDAWYNGYTIEPEKKYNVFAPKSWIAGHEVENRVVAFCKKNNGNIGYYQTCKQYLGASKYQFTIEEIKKYDLENFHKELVTDDSED